MRRQKPIKRGFQKGSQGQKLSKWKLKAIKKLAKVLSLHQLSKWVMTLRDERGPQRKKEEKHLIKRQNDTLFLIINTMRSSIRSTERNVESFIYDFVIGNGRSSRKISR